jgi:hypothetical protein
MQRWSRAGPKTGERVSGSKKRANKKGASKPVVVRGPKAKGSKAKGKEGSAVVQEGRERGTDSDPSGVVSDGGLLRGG